MGRSRFEAEFGSYTSWLVDAIEALGLEDPVPAACRGTGNPSLLTHLADALEVGPGELVLDIGVGIGGPAAWLARKKNCDVVGIDVMQAAAQGVRRLFPSVSVVVSTTRALPFPTGSFHAAWSLGVVEMIADKPTAFAEMHRVLAPRARLAVYDFVSKSEDLEGAPLADRFCTAAALERDFAAARFSIIESTAPDFPSAPPTWQDAVDRVREAVRRDHDGDRTLHLAESQRESFNRLRVGGDIEEWQFLLERGPDD